MGRGKLKYRDVVGGGRKKGGDGRHNSRSSKLRKGSKSKPQRKTYSLHQKDGSRSGPVKRKPDHHNSRPKVPEKRPKLEEEVKRQVSSSEDEESGDDLKELLATFGGNVGKEETAIDSKEDSSEDEGQEESANDGKENAASSDEEKSSSEGEHEKGDNAETVEAEEQEENDEAEENEENEAETGADQEEEDSAADPFVRHLSYDLHENLLKALSAEPIGFNTDTQEWPELGKVITRLPKCEEIKEQECSLEDSQKFAPQATPPQRIDPKSGSSNLFIKPQITGNITKANPALDDDSDVIMTPFQAELFSVMNNYQDLCYCERTFENAEEIRFAYCLHAVNHILKTRTKVIHHNARLSKKDKDDVPDEFRDQGLVRPKILIILPFKDAAYRVVRMLIGILLGEDTNNVIKKKRFIEDFTGDELVMPKKNPKPDDYVSTFAGNCGDDFKLGITVTKKSLKLYADFYSSDIIIASTLGLRRIIGAQGETDRDFDFLASIELLIIDQAEVFLMQNWEHMLHVLKHMHMQPKDTHGTDICRIRYWSTNGWGRYYRQTLLFAGTALPEINNVFNRRCFNYAGKVKVANPVKDGSLSRILVQHPQYFRKFDASSPQQVIDARFDFFVNKVLPEHREPSMKQTLVYVPNYYDFVKIRNHFLKEEINFVQICEYSKEGRVARARDLFFHGDTHFLLYTERHQFFNRIKIKGIRHLVFYQPPNFPHFYAEMCNFMQESNMNKKVGNSLFMTISVIYSKYDSIQMEGVLGTERFSKMLKSSDRNVHMIVTER